MALTQSAPPPQIELGAKTAQREPAARALVPLLKDVRRRAQPGISIQPGGAPNSPFTGTQTTLFAFTVGKRSVPVDPRVVQAMDTLIAWKAGDAKATAAAALFDEWLDQLTIKSAGLGLTAGLTTCDTSCVISRMTTLDETWGSSPKYRAELRDEMLLDALTKAVIK
jgi:hypothetical protein